MNKIPPIELTRLYNQLAAISDNDYAEVNVEENFNSFKSYIESFYKNLFKKKISYEISVELIDAIFNKQIIFLSNVEISIRNKEKVNQIKERYRREITASIISLERVIKEDTIYSLKHRLELAKENCYDIIGLIVAIGKDYKLKDLEDCIWYKRENLFSYESFHTAKSFLYNTDKNLISPIALIGTSIFLIRQTIELFLKRIFDISEIYNNKTGKLISLSIEELIQILETNKDSWFVKGSLNLYAIKKIYSWTNRSIHWGNICNSWTLEWAIYFLNPIYTNTTYREISGKVVHSYNSFFLSMSFKEEIKQEMKNKIACKFKSEGLSANDIEIEFFNSNEFKVLTDDEFKILKGK